MSLTKLVLVVQETDSSGKTNFRRLDTEEFIPVENIRMAKQQPIILNFDSSTELPIYITKARGFREKANALLVGEKVSKGYGDYEGYYCSASYCKI